MILKIFNNNKRLVDAPEINLPDFVVITGANGSGKTQLLTEINNRYLRHDDGRFSSHLFIDNENGTSEMNFRDFMLKIENGDNEGLTQYGAGGPNKIEFAQSYNFNPTGGNIQSPYDDVSNYQKHTMIASFLHSELLKNPSFNLDNIDTGTIESLNNTYQQVMGERGFSSSGARAIDYHTINLINKVSKNSGRNFSELKYYDFIIYDDIPQNELFSINLSLLFKRYIYEYNFYPEKRTTEKPPWIIFEEILSEGNLPYSINIPDINNPDAVIIATLIDKEQGIEIPFESLSSGEKTVMSLVFALYNSYGKNKDTPNIFPDVLLLDEPDASLHPSLTEYFLRVIEKTFVERNGIKVIMTTHSPSTVALAPESSVFSMENGRLNQTDKNKAIKLLTEGLNSLTILYRNQKQVFIEADFDKIFYENLFDILKFKYLDRDILLSFIPSGPKSEQGSSKVITYTDLLFNNGNKSISGLIDWDLKNLETPRIKVFGLNNRYAIENYIFDPVFLAFFLLYENDNNIQTISFTANDTIISVAMIDNIRLQGVVDSVVRKIFDVINQLPDIEDSDRESKEKLLNEIFLKKGTVLVELLNGYNLSIPKWYLEIQGHTLEIMVKKAFPKLSATQYNQKHYTLKESILIKVIRSFPTFLPIEVIEPFKKLQALPID